MSLITARKIWRSGVVFFWIRSEASWMLVAIRNRSEDIGQFFWCFVRPIIWKIGSYEGSYFLSHGRMMTRWSWVGIVW
jgi:hypothetical protein